MMGLGVWELSIILVIVIVVFGAARLPKIGEGLGRGIMNFKKEVKTIKERDEAQASDNAEENLSNKTKEV